MTSALQFESATGVAIVTFDAQRDVHDIAPDLEYATRYLVTLGPIVRAVVLHVPGSCSVPKAPSRAVVTLSVPSVEAL